ncbi:MAG: OsmC family protein [Candidatus Aenigmarchaeota archaeon]|nr:OsmC family protein [Candidatus Aenigmarchaeota archaeon]
MKINNVDLEQAGAFVEAAKKDLSKALKSKRVDGEWSFRDGTAQFRAALEHAQGTTSIEADAPPFLGGQGSKPDPVQYCLYGLAACFAQTFATIAAEKGVVLQQLKVSAENQVNLAKAIGLGDAPAVERAKITVVARAENGARLSEIEQAARERCPGVYCLTHPIRLEIETKGA